MMSMNKTCPISNFTSEERSDGMSFYYLKTRDLTSLFRFYIFAFIDGDFVNQVDERAKMCTAQNPERNESRNQRDSGVNW